MTRRTLLLSMTTLMTFLIACSPGDRDAVKSANPLLDLVPADTPYLLANLEPIPEPIVNAYLVRMQPLLDEMQLELAKLRAAFEETDPDADEESFAAVAAAVLAEFDGNMTRSGLESLGFSLESVNAIYGNGMFPVARLGLGNADAFRAMVARVEANSGQSIPRHELQGKTYWRAGDPGEPMALYMAILDDHVVITAAPVALETQLLPGILGLEQPDRSVQATGDLMDLNREKNFSPYGSGYLDLQLMATEFFSPDSLTATSMDLMGLWKASEIDPACESEARLFTTLVPRLVAGVTKLDANAIDLRYQVEMDNGLAKEMSKLVSDVPPASIDPGNMLSASLNIEVGTLRQWLLEKSDALAEKPFLCPQLATFNEDIQQAAKAMNQPMPPFIGNLKGLRAALSEFSPGEADPKNMRGLLSLEMTSPQMVVGMASMMIPGFEELDLQPGDEPVAMPEEIMSISTPEFEAHVVMSKDAIGISLGEGQNDRLLPFLEESTDPDGIVMSVDYDTLAIMKLQEAAMADWEDANGVPQAAASSDLATAYEALMGRTRIEIRLDKRGITVDQLQSFR